MLTDDDAAESSHKPWVRRTAWLLLLSGLGGGLIGLHEQFGLKVLLAAVLLSIAAVVVYVIRKGRRRARIVEISPRVTSSTDT